MRLNSATRVDLRNVWLKRAGFCVCAVLLTAGILVYGSQESGYSTLPDGSKIKLLGVTIGKSHHISWKLFSTANAVRKYSTQLGPYIAPELTDVDTTSSVDCVVFWTRRVFTSPNVRPLSAIVADEAGHRDRVIQGPGAFAVLRDRFNPTSDGVVQGWAVPRSSHLGRDLALNLYERIDTSTGTVTALATYRATNTLEPVTGPPPSAEEPQSIGGYTVSLAGFTSGVPYQPPGGFFDGLFRPAGGGREFFGTSVTLAVTGPDADRHQLFARRVKATSAGGVTFTTYNLAQTTGPGTLDISFSPTCNLDSWKLEFDLADQRSTAVRTAVVENIVTKDEGGSNYDDWNADPSERWYFGTRSAKTAYGDNLNLQIRCGPMDDDRLLCSISAFADTRKPIYVTRLTDENCRRIAFDRDDAFSLRCWLNRRSRLRLELADWPPSSYVFQSSPLVLMPELTQAEPSGQSKS